MRTRYFILFHDTYIYIYICGEKARLHLVRGNELNYIRSNYPLILVTNVQCFLVREKRERLY